MKTAAFLLLTISQLSSGQKVTFSLYTRAHNWTSVAIPNNLDTLAGTGFNASAQTFVIMHTFVTVQDFRESLVESLLNHFDCNVFVVDYELVLPLHKIVEPYFALNYFRHSEPVGRRVGEVLAAAIINGGLRPDLTHIVGHGLGAHCAGKAARTVEEITSFKVAQITGLDPNYLTVDPQAEHNRLHKNDAHFVSVIHTQGGKLHEGSISYLKPLGDVDFYPSGGMHQPGCKEYCFFDERTCVELKLVDMSTLCSHHRAILYFAQSIAGSTKFWATKCDSYQAFLAGNCTNNAKMEMGLHVKTSGFEHGKYYLAVHEHSPYAVGDADHELPLEDLRYFFHDPSTPDPRPLPFPFDELEYDIDTTNDTFVLMHGWTENSKSSWGEYAKEIVATLNANVIVVDWGQLASIKDYYGSVDRALRVGDFTGKLLLGLREKVGLNLAKVHLVGFSMGSHGMARAAMWVTKKSPGGDKIPRLTALDPAKPFFDVLDPADILNKDVAKFVDVIHTNGGHLHDGRVGFMKPLGHIDFYPNGGRHQLHCEEKCNFFCTDDFLKEIFTVACSHRAAPEFFFDSLTEPEKYLATKCPSWEEFQAGDCKKNNHFPMGYLVDGYDVDEGTYYLKIERP